MRTQLIAHQKTSVLTGIREVLATHLGTCEEDGSCDIFPHVIVVWDTHAAVLRASIESRVRDRPESLREAFGPVGGSEVRFYDESRLSR